MRQAFAYAHAITEREARRRLALVVEFACSRRFHVRDHFFDSEITINADSPLEKTSSSMGGVVSLLDALARDPDVRHVFVLSSSDLDPHFVWDPDLDPRAILLENCVRVLESNGREIVPVEAEGADEPLPQVVKALPAKISAENAEARRAFRRQSATDGFHITGPAPYGYERVDGVLTVLEPEAALVRAAFSDYLRPGATLAGVTRALNALGRTRRGGKWGLGTVAYLLNNEAYVGVVTYMDIRAKGKHEPVVGRSDFNNVRAKLRRNNRKFKESSRGEGRVAPPTEP